MFYYIEIPRANIRSIFLAKSAFPGQIILLYGLLSRVLNAETFYLPVTNICPPDESMT